MNLPIQTNGLPDAYVCMAYLIVRGCGSQKDGLEKIHAALPDQRLVAPFWPYGAGDSVRPDFGVYA